MYVVTGDGKADSLRDVMRQRQAAAKANGAVQEGDLPSARVRSGRVAFLVDKPAASKLDDSVQQQLHKL